MLSHLFSFLIIFLLLCLFQSGISKTLQTSDELEYDVNVAPKAPNIFQKLRIQFEHIRSQWRIKAMETFQRFHGTSTTTKAPNTDKLQRKNNRQPALVKLKDDYDYEDDNAETLQFYGALSDKFKN